LIDVFPVIITELALFECATCLPLCGGCIIALCNNGLNLAAKFGCNRLVVVWLVSMFSSQFGQVWGEMPGRDIVLGGCVASLRPGIETVVYVVVLTKSTCCCLCCGEMHNDFEF
jgi:hypothetical protein